MSAALSPSPSFSSLVQDFFCQRLLAQRNASPQTIASYRDASACCSTMRSGGCTDCRPHSLLPILTSRSFSASSTISSATAPMRFGRHVE